MYLFDDLLTHLEKGFQVFFSCKTGEGIFADRPTLETKIPANEHIVLSNIDLKKGGKYLNFRIGKYYSITDDEKKVTNSGKQKQKHNISHRGG